jgi:hypothetical protein
MKIKAFFIIACIALAGFSPVSESKNEFDNRNGSLYSVLNQQNTDQLLLVGLTDNTIKSVISTASQTSYRQRGDAYQNSTWSKRITNELAEEYDLVKMTEWPMTEVGVHCVVYKISDKTTLSTAIERLSKDARVKIVQNMHVLIPKGNITTILSLNFKPIWSRRKSVWHMAGPQVRQSL